MGRQGVLGIQVDIVHQGKGHSEGQRSQEGGMKEKER